MDSVKALQKRFPSVDGSVVAMVFHECEDNYDVAAQKLEEMAVDHSSNVMAAPRNMYGSKYWSQDLCRKPQGEEWSGNSYAVKSHSGTTRGKDEKLGTGSGKRWNQNESRYQNGNWENGDERDELSEENGWKPYSGGPGIVGMGMRLHQEGSSGGSRMGPNQGSEFVSTHPGMNYYDFYPRMANAGPRPMGPAMGPGPSPSGMRMGPGPGMGPGRGYDHSGGMRMGNIHRPGQFYDNHQYQSATTGGARGQHPHHLPGQHPYMMSTPYSRQLQVPPHPQGAYPQGAAVMNHGDKDDRKMGQSSGHSYMGRPHPSGQGRMDDFHMVTRDRRHQDKSKDYSREPMYPLMPSHSQSAEAMSGGRGEKKMILLRGLPGSGKSTLAKSLVGPYGVICCTDDFFLVNGRYMFDPSKLSENHQKNKEKARGAMQMGKSPVIIDNTNSTAWEMKPYINMAVKEFGYSVEILEPTTPWRFKSAELARKNIHGVTRQTIERILEKFEHRVSVESMLEGSSSSSSSFQQMRSVSAPSAPDHGTTQETSQESGQASKSEDSSDRSLKLDVLLKPKENLVSGVSLTSEGEKKLKRSVSPDPRGARVDDQVSSSVGHSPRGRGRGRGDVLAASGRGRGGVSGRRSGGLHGIAKEMEDRGKSDVYLKSDSVWQVDSQNEAKNFVEDAASLYWDIPAGYQDYDNDQGLKFKVGEVRNVSTENDSSSMRKATGSGTAGQLKEISPTYFPSTRFTPEASFDLDSDNRDIGNVNPKTESFGSKSGSTGRLNDHTGRKLSTGDVLSFQAPASRKTSEERRASLDWSEKSSSIGGEVWSVATDTTASREDFSSGAVSRISFTSEEKRPEEKRDTEQTGKMVLDRNEGDVWDSEDELDLSKEEEGTVLSDGGSDEVSTDDGPVDDTEVLSKKMSGGASQGNDNTTGEVAEKVTKKSGLVKLGEAINSTLFKRYVSEGQMDEVKYTLRDQKKLVRQLVVEQEKKRSLAVPSGECLTLEAVLCRAKLDGLQTQLPSVLIEMMFRDRQLVPRWKVGEVEELSEEIVASETAPAKIASARKESRLLKLVPKGESPEESVMLGNRDGSEEAGTENENESDTGDSDEVKDPAIMHIVVAKPPVSKDSMESVWKEPNWPQSGIKASSALPLPLTRREGSKQDEASLVERKDGPVPNQASSLSWLSGTSQWANPNLLSSVLPEKMDPLPLLVDEEKTAGPLKTSLPKLPVEKLAQNQLLPSSAQHVCVVTEVVNVSAPSTFIPTVGAKPSKFTGRKSSSEIKPSSTLGAIASSSFTNTIDSAAAGEATTSVKFSWEVGKGKDQQAPESGPQDRRLLEPWGGASESSRIAHGSGKMARVNGHVTHHDDHVPLENEFSVNPNMFPSAIEDDDDTPRQFGLASAASAEFVVPTSSNGKTGSSQCPNNGESSDLDFLAECFPHLRRDYLQHLLTVNEGNMELTTVSALATVPDDALKLDDDKDHAYPSESKQPGGNYSNGHASAKSAGRASSEPLLETKVGEKVSLNSFGLGTAVVNGHGTASRKNWQEITGSGNERKFNGDDMPQLVAWTGAKEEGGRHWENDKARQEILDWDVPEEEEDGSMEKLQNGTELLLEDNLVLKLSKSLSIQLQRLFGRVDRSLFHQGGLDSDLEVLLSEKAAAEIYRKWIDTLEARKVEYQVRSQLQGKSREASRTTTAAGNIPAVSSVPEMGKWGGARGGAGGGVSGSEGNRYTSIGQSLNCSPGSAKQGGVMQGSQAARREGSQLHLLNKSRPRPHMARSPQKIEVEFSESGPSYDETRAEAEHHAHLRSEYFQKAAEARSNKRYDTASYYAQKGHHHTQKMKDANRRAASNTLGHKNVEHPSNRIDLHGLHVNEAVAALSKKMNESEEGEVLMVITGYGRGGQHEGKIKPVIKRYLDQKNVRYEEKNPGLFRVIVK